MHYLCNIQMKDKKINKNQIILSWHCTLIEVNNLDLPLTYYLYTKSYNWIDLEKKKHLKSVEKGCSQIQWTRVVGSGHAGTWSMTLNIFWLSLQHCLSNSIMHGQILIFFLIYDLLSIYLWGQYTTNTVHIILFKDGDSNMQAWSHAYLIFFFQGNGL